jgi:leucyl aminopeptidase
MAMKFQITVENPIKHACRALVVGCFEDDVSDPLFTKVDRAMGGYLGDLYRQHEFSGKPNKTRLIHTLGRIPAERLILVGLGKKMALTGERIRQGAGAAMQAMRGTGLKGCTTLLHLAGTGGDEFLQAAIEGAALGGYSFLQYKTKNDDKGGIEEVSILFPPRVAVKRVDKVLADAQTVCEAVLFARDLVAQPGNVATPIFLGEKAMEISAKNGIACKVLERDEIQQNGMEALLAVAKGSCQPPRFIILEYMAAGEKVKPTVLIGKGITFDSGGISLKPRDGMEKMKDDMAGGAAVMGTLMAAAALKLPVNVVGLIPAAENLPGGGAYKPGDVVKSMSGQTIEIVNTDAEGRMILCDALHFAQRYKPAAIIDLATLTGACVVALGSFASGMMGNDEGVKRTVKSAADKCGERVWELPLWEEYGELIKSDIADMKNAGGSEAGTISAAWFLKNFVGKSRWVHLDIAGTAWMDKDRPYMPKGATGVGVRLLVEYLRGVAKGR